MQHAGRQAKPVHQSHSLAKLSALLCTQVGLDVPSSPSIIWWLTQHHSGPDAARRVTSICVSTPNVWWATNRNSLQVIKRPERGDHQEASEDHPTGKCGILESSNRRLPPALHITSNTSESVTVIHTPPSPWTLSSALSPPPESQQSFLPLSLP